MLRILITDDHQIIRKGLGRILKEEFPSVIIDEACDAESAINKTKSKKFDILICDLSMPGSSGIDVLNHVSQNLPGLPVLIISIHPEEQYAHRLRDAGAAGFLNKGAAAEQLVNAVQTILNGQKYYSSS